ncbi:MAG: hypothetical protein VYA80_02360 [Pseudomonadota bacterium]|nr:hypothetical protein [Pseudomonadota bacterium]
MFVRFLATLDMDPHGYFEKQYVSRIERSFSEAEIREVLVELLQWVESNEISDKHRTALGKKLEKFGMAELI